MKWNRCAVLYFAIDISLFLDSVEYPSSVISKLPLYIILSRKEYIVKKGFPYKMFALLAMLHTILRFLFFLQTHGMNDSLYYEHAYTKDMVSDDMILNIPTNYNHTIKSTTKGKGIEILPTSVPKFNVSTKYSGKCSTTLNQYLIL